MIKGRGSGIYWRNGFILFIIASPFLAFKYDYISKDWINRIGIIANFLAGFLVAPDLLGEKRLILLEDEIEKKADNWYSFLSDKYLLWKTNLDWAETLLSLTIIFFIYLQILKNKEDYQVQSFAIFSVLFIGILIPFIIILLSLIESIFKMKYTTRIRLRNYYLTFYRIFLGPITILTYAAGLSFLKVLEYVLSKLLGNYQLKGILIWWGVLLFIMGNLMQLVATFDYPNKAASPPSTKTEAPYK